MDLIDKLSILADAAKYDASCSSSGSFRKTSISGIGNGNVSGICHTWSNDGRCISLLKILFTNRCIYDCVYCYNRASNEISRTSFTVKEICDLTINFYIRNYIEGLFLSSAVEKSPSQTMEKLLQVVKSLRKNYKFNGYIHLKVIPGADIKLINEAGKYADRLSINIELPSNESLKLLAPQKSKEQILLPMKYLSHKITQNKEEKKLFKNTPNYVPAGQSTQMIIGATNDNDYQIVKLSESLYKKFGLKRVYYSAYIPTNKDNKLPTIFSPPLKRENRIYQADWLLRFYGFNADELFNKKEKNFDINLDPKTQWAINNLEKFPVEINKVDYKILIRVPGIGIKSALKIVTARKVNNLNFNDLKKLGVSMKKSKYFIQANGKFLGDFTMNNEFIKNKIIADKSDKTMYNQISIFDMNNNVLNKE